LKSKRNVVTSSKRSDQSRRVSNVKKKSIAQNRSETLFKRAIGHALEKNLSDVQRLHFKRGNNQKVVFNKSEQIRVLRRSLWRGEEKKEWLERSTSEWNPTVRGGKKRNILKDSCARARIIKVEEVSVEVH